MEVKVFGLGGTGINVVKAMNLKDTKEFGIARIQTAYIDTSNANTQNAQDVLVLNGSGSGMVRSTNYATIKDEIKEILLGSPASDMNILVHSASGGTGSIFGNLMVKEILANPSKDVIVVLVGSRGSEIEVKNTISTIKTYAAISKELNRTIPVLFFENTPEVPRGMVDNNVRGAIAILTALFSGDNQELDKKDLSNWLNYNRVSEYGADLSAIVIQSTPTMKKGWVPVSMVTLADRENAVSTNLAVKMHKMGFIDRGVATTMSMELPVSFINVLGFMPEILKQYEELLNSFKSLDVVKVSSIDTSGSSDGVFL